MSQARGTPQFMLKLSAFRRATDTNFPWLVSGAPQGGDIPREFVLIELS
jgi:hypothetical protein